MIYLINTLRTKPGHVFFIWGLSPSILVSHSTVYILDSIYSIKSHNSSVDRRGMGLSDEPILSYDWFMELRYSISKSENFRNVFYFFWLKKQWDQLLLSRFSSHIVVLTTLSNKLFTHTPSDVHGDSATANHHFINQSLCYQKVLYI